jgi:hypothetical protein
MCAVCKQGVAKESMEYQKGRVFHPKCFEIHGKTFPIVDPDLAHLSAKTRIELVQMRNLKARVDAGLFSIPKSKKKKVAKKSTKPKKQRTIKRQKKSKTKSAKKRTSKSRR